MANSIYTIGHSNHTWEVFYPLLRENGVQLLVGVRTNPVSRFAPFASKGTLPALLEREGIGYVFLGDTLGGKACRSRDVRRQGQAGLPEDEGDGGFQPGNRPAGGAGGGQDGGGHVRRGGPRQVPPVAPPGAGAG